MCVENMLVKLFAKTVSGYDSGYRAVSMIKQWANKVKGDTGYTRKALDQSRSPAQNLGSWQSQLPCSSITSNIRIQCKIWCGSTRCYYVIRVQVFVCSDCLQQERKVCERVCALIWSDQSIYSKRKLTKYPIIPGSSGYSPYERCSPSLPGSTSLIYLVCPSLKEKRSTWPLVTHSF